MGQSLQTAPKPKYSVCMSKKGFHPKEIEDMINSKAEALNLGKTKFLKNVIQSFQIQETANETLHKSRISTKKLRELDILPPSSTDGEQLGPSTLTRSQVKNLNKKYKEEQQKLFQLLLDAGMLNKDDYSSRDGYLEVLSIRGKLLYCLTFCQVKGKKTRISSVDLCNVLDELAISFKDKQPSNPRERDTMEKVRKLCELITYQRICATWKYPDDILKEKGYKRWCYHLWMVASFAAVIIGLDICLDQTRTGSLVSEYNELEESEPLLPRNSTITVEAKDS